MKAAYYRPTPVLRSAIGDFENLGTTPDLLPVYEQDPQFVIVPAGAINCRPDCWYLVEQGTARAADAECEQKVAMSPQQTIRRYERQIALENGELTGDPKIDVPHKRS